MGLSGTWIILGLAIGSIACLGNAVPQWLGSEEDPPLNDDDLSSNGQKFSSASNTITHDGHTLTYGSGENIKVIHNGHRFAVDHGVISVLEGTKTYRFRPLEATVEKTQSIDINGRPAKVQFSKGSVFLYFADGTVMAGIGKFYYVGDRYAVENRDRMIASSYL